MLVVLGLNVGSVGNFSQLRMVKLFSLPNLQALTLRQLPRLQEVYLSHYMDNLQEIKLQSGLGALQEVKFEHLSRGRLGTSRAAGPVLSVGDGPEDTTTAANLYGFRSYQSELPQLPPNFGDWSANAENIVVQEDQAWHDASNHVCQALVLSSASGHPRLNELHLKSVDCSQPAPLSASQGDWTNAHRLHLYP